MIGLVNRVTGRHWVFYLCGMQYHRCVVSFTLHDTNVPHFKIKTSRLGSWLGDVLHSNRSWRNAPLHPHFRPLVSVWDPYRVT
jgi:hypothetical protein